MQRGMGLTDITLVGCGAHYRMHQTGLSLHADIRVASAMVPSRISNPK